MQNMRYNIFPNSQSNLLISNKFSDLHVSGMRNINNMPLYDKENITIVIS